MIKNINSTSDGYQDWIHKLKQQIQVAQHKAAFTVNKQIIQLYFNLGQQLYTKQQSSKWGDKMINQVSMDLKTAFPGVKGFSVTNLKYMKQFYRFYTSNQIGQQAVDQNQNSIQPTDNQIHTFSQQAVDQIPWGHNILIFTKIKGLEEANFYIHKTIENHWSRDVLALQIKSDLYNRSGKAITNFKDTLPKPLSDLAQQTIKDPYVFDFMSMTTPFNEKDIEDQLTNHVSKFLLELGKGFAFIGKQYHLEIAQQDYYLDLLFYHVVLKCYVIIELKNTKFIPEYAGKLNFYLSAVDSKLKTEADQPTIGIILCRDKNNVEVEFSLRGMRQPMGVSEFSLTESLPEELKSSLPTIEEFEKELEK